MARGRDRIGDRVLGDLRRRPTAAVPAQLVLGTHRRRRASRGAGCPVRRHHRARPRGLARPVGRPRPDRGVRTIVQTTQRWIRSVSYTHLTLPTNREESVCGLGDVYKRQRHHRARPRGLARPVGRPRPDRGVRTIVQTTQRWIRWPAGTHNRTPTEGRNGPIAFGGDYNPEQWSEDVWQEDVRLMQEAGVNLVTVGVFSWARLQPTPDTWEFEWLDRVLDLLHEHGIAVDLATATASPPVWLTTAHPEMLPVDRLGTVLHQGGRQAWSPSSVVYREHSLRLVEKMAERYASHPALSMWHVSNELGCHNGRCYSELSAQGFRRWLRERYTDLDTFNRAWATDFWSQHYGTWEEIEPPRIAPSFSNPTQQLDFARFSSDALRDQLRAEVEVLRRHTPDVPVTTNFMVMGHFKEVVYRTWVDDLDLVSNDHYLMAHDPDAHVELAFSADQARGLAGGQPWMLIE